MRYWIVEWTGTRSPDWDPVAAILSGELGAADVRRHVQALHAARMSSPAEMLSYAEGRAVPTQ